ncbi:site-specific DNA-methyltransferase [Listeria monocytogenes]|nr:site-specific DNA-methyltransferase [Listeria monocytogenes]EIZ2734039.1 site-specific DNA-methyltransferase [Listeria monocytogenes]EIZ2736891.1 site-specific DNA-methyltransferase [Listeria monocytogenes]EIZ2828194.1 site-specific DNA-methyltransferase [Listeria monocytogenes]EIZ2931978.1 site-specific DNA-methyltransferase [Listeria monocytogenes]
MENKIWNEDCLKGMLRIRDNSIDMILCDLPYGRTKNTWDELIDLEKLWIQYDRIIKENGAIILTAQTPFDKMLGASNIDNLRYEWIWEKTAATGHLNAKKMPLKAHENILVFYKKLPIYNPQKTVGHTAVHSYTKKQTDGSNYGRTKAGITGGGSTERYPRSVLTFKSDKQKSSLHPTQKPVALFEYLIKTYTNEGGLVLDNCMGSGTTAIACLNTNRKYIGFETDVDHYESSLSRIANHCCMLKEVQI